MSIIREFDEKNGCISYNNSCKNITAVLYYKCKNITNVLCLKMKLFLEERGKVLR